MLARAALKASSWSAGTVRELLAGAEPVTIIERIAACRDPKDDKFLEPAVNSRADVIVSGDADLLELDAFRGIPIMPPAAFVRRMGRLIHPSS